VGQMGQGNSTAENKNTHNILVGILKGGGTLVDLGLDVMLKTM